MKSRGLPAEVRTRKAFKPLLESIRKQGVAAVTDYHLVPGVAAVAAPVFNAKGEITLSVLAIGVKGMIDLSAKGAVVAALKRSAQGLSERLGYSPDVPPGSA